MKLRNSMTRGAEVLKGSVREQSRGNSISAVPCTFMLITYFMGFNVLLKKKAIHARVEKKASQKFKCENQVNRLPWFASCETIKFPVFH